MTQYLRENPVNMTYGRVDNNQDEIVKALEKFGASVMSLTQVKYGCPDLVVGFRGKNYLIEIKNPKTSGKLTEAQKRFIKKWPAPIYVVYDVQQALDVVMESGDE